jgi:serine/threonine protein kinase
MLRDGLHLKCLARDTALGRDVEVRMIHGGATSDERRAELIEEARHLARLQHPSIPPIYEVSFDDKGQIFYTTKPVAGVSLREILDELERGKTSSLLHFSLRRLLSVFHRVCDAIAYAHSREIAHWDLKPEHILLGEFGEVFVTGWRPPRAGLEEGEVSRQFHPRDDITALGKILYEMTNLLHPPETDRSGAPARGAVKNAAARAWSGDKDVKALAAIASRALDSKVAGRFYSVRELQKQVDAFKDSFDDPAHVTLETILRQWVQRHRIALIIAGILLVLALAGGVWFTLRSHDGSDRRSPIRVELPHPAPRQALTSLRVPGGARG